MKRIYIPVNKFFLSILSSEYNVASWTAKKNHQQQNKKQQLSITNMETINSINHRKTSVTIWRSQTKQEMTQLHTDPLWSSNKHLEVGYISNWIILIRNIPPICNGEKEKKIILQSFDHMFYHRYHFGRVFYVRNNTMQCKCWKIQQSDGSTDQPT